MTKHVAGFRDKLKTIFRASCAALPLVAAAVLPASAASKFTLGAVQWIGYGPIYVAAAKGFFTAHGLDLDIVNFDDNAAMPGALYSGQVTAATLTYDQVIASNAKGWNLKVVQPIDYSAGADAIVADDSIKSITQIKGMKVAYAPLSPSDFLLGYALSHNGMSESDITSVNTTAEGVAGIMAGGSTKVGVTYEPTVSSITQLDGGKKFHVIFSSKQAPGLIVDVIAVTPKMIKNHPQLISDFLAAFVEGETYMAAHPQEADVIIGKALSISPSDAAAQLAGVQNPTLAEMPDVLSKSDHLPSFYVTGPVIGTLLKNEGQISSIPPIAKTYDASFVSAMLKSN